MARTSSLTAWLVLALAVLCILLPEVAAKVDDPAQDAKQYHKEFALFRSANMANPDKLPSGIGFHSFRIPSVVTTSTGRILAFAEGRRHDNRDYGDINLVYKRTKTTSDHGASPSDWEGLQEVVGKGSGTWGNPTAVVDGDTIYLFLSWNSGAYSQNGGDTLPDGTVTKPIDKSWEGRRHLYLTKSTDDGKTWSEPEDMTKQLTPDGQAWDAVGPGIGITLRSGELVIPAQGRNIIGTGEPGKRTWEYQTLSGAGSEGTIAQTPDGKLYRNDRASSTDGYRKVARGDLSNFSSFSLDTGLPDPGCEGATLLYNLADDKGPARTIFMNSADKDSRRKMRVRVSYDDDAAKWNYGRELADAPVSGAGHEGGYSSMTKTADFKIGALVETDFYQTGGSKGDYRAIVWRRFNLSWILNGPRN
ncbi:Exo-alpha-sialidase-like protein [Hapsidospora chrysogenum ATCC 11550]|uniref:exo-alpha-sialidase n=1 Tax=Hapsidospora chrysogenum (strain ATCC 11550 / CBS 779.69 / DSM 880 / IAM 14645 / JCM 23072 / IMI 49137) TaxID=857340 RepID=A0A086SWF2_HAPC1|nr:Exo-alpha-sialidase-like protein [Hapsidospora chrysogenum ATCC 11550]